MEDPVEFLGLSEELDELSEELLEPSEELDALSDELLELSDELELELLDDSPDPLPLALDEP